MSLHSEKLQLVSLLEDTVPCLSYVPQRMTPPVAIITTGNPYLESGATYGTFVVRWQITLVFPTASADVSDEAMDNLVDDVVVLLVNNKYGVDNVSAPFAMEANNTQYLAITVSTNKQINL